MASSVKEFAKSLFHKNYNEYTNLINERDIEITRLARAQAVKEAAATICQHCAANEELVEYQNVWKHKIGGFLRHCYAHAILALLTQPDKDALAEKTSYEKLKAMMESEEGWIAPDKVAEHDAEILGIRDREWIEALGFDFQPENEIPALIVNESRAEHEKELDERYKKKLADYCEMVDKEQVVKQAEHDRQVRLKGREEVFLQRNARELR
jgi:hypothetical protein